MKKTLIAVLSLTAVSLAGVNGQVVINYAFTNNSTSPTSGSPLNFAISDFTIGNSFGTVSAPANSSSTSSGYSGATGGSNFGNAFRTGALNTGSSGSGFFEFTITPSTGYTFQLSQFDFGVRSTSTGAQTLSLRSNLDSYGADIFTSVVANTGAWSAKTNSFTFNSQTDAAVTFRLFGYGGTGSASSGTINTRIDDVSLTITATAVPEPSTWALIGLGSAFVLWRMRRKAVI